MARQMAIWIPCPQYGKRMRGAYESDASGEFRLAPDGAFLLDFARCSQDGGRCMQTLCALHRFNRRGPGTWYPERIQAIRPRKPGGKDRRAPRGPRPPEGVDELA